jgi:hypothetical protein
VDEYLPSLVIHSSSEDFIQCIYMKLLGLGRWTNRWTNVHCHPLVVHCQLAQWYQQDAGRETGQWTKVRQGGEGVSSSPTTHTRSRRSPEGLIRKVRYSSLKSALTVRNAELVPCFAQLPARSPVPSAISGPAHPDARPGPFCATNPLFVFSFRTRQPGTRSRHPN